MHQFYQQYCLLYSDANAERIGADVRFRGKIYYTWPSLPANGKVTGAVLACYSAAMADVF